MYTYQTSGHPASIRKYISENLAKKLTGKTQHNVERSDKYDHHPEFGYILTIYLERPKYIIY